jgi:hypothetical protein
MHPEAFAVVSSGTAILNRVLEARTPNFTPDAARVILKLQFGQVDLDRMNVLAEKNRQGVLTEAEWHELQNYLLVGHLLDLLHAKARVVIC